MKITYDTIIVGGGHAGLSATLTLYRQLHSVLILDGRKPRNAWPLPTHAVSGWEGRQAEELRTVSRDELERTGLVTSIELEARSVQRVDYGFEMKDEPEGRWQGRKLLIATGKKNAFPDIPGFAEN
ncbi:hypothetical protein Hte_010729 [Hypoxylon texense]